jgi:DNA-binding NtrC family response regulator
MRSGEFREDLYYRLNVVEIHVPPLRERPEAISSLARSFLVRYNAQYLRDVTLLPETVALMTTYSWPGNVRELENFIRRLVVLGDSQRAHRDLLDRIKASSAGHAVPPAIPGRNSGLAPESIASGTPLVAAFDLKAIARCAAREAEHAALIEVLERVRWNRMAAARILKVSYKTLLSKLTECGIVDPKRRPPA